MKRGNTEMIPSLEKNVLQWIEAHILWFAIPLFTVVSLWIRYSMRAAESGDALSYLLPWFDEIVANGGLKSLGTQVGDYNILYQTLIAFFTYLPIKPLYAYKIFSIVFDYLLAVVITLLVYHLSGKKKDRALFAYVLAVLFPVFFLNSAYWAQCDGIYSFFCVLALYLLIKENYAGTFISLGFAFAFKLQAVFILPLFIFLYLYKKKYSLLYFFLIPFVLICSGFFGYLNGRSVPDVFSIYLDQTESYPYMSMNYASFWNVLQDTLTYDGYELLKKAAILLTVAALGLIMLFHIRHRTEMNAVQTVETAFLMVYTCVFFLPCMHERYDYLVLALAVALVFLDKKMIPVLLVLTYISLRSYAAYLFKLTVNWELLSLLNLLCYAWVCRYLLQKSLRAGKETAAPMPETEAAG